MEKKFLRILSFVMVAMFALTLTGLVISAEEIDIPVIEEVTEEEMGEELIEEEVVEAFAEETEIAKEDAYFEILDGDRTHVWYFADLQEALNSDKLQNGYTLMMLKDYTWDNTLADTSKGESTGIKIPAKNFIWNGGGLTITDNFNKANFTPAGGQKGGHDNNASYALTSANSKITIENITFSGNAQNTATSQGHTNGCLRVGAGTLTLKNVNIKNYQGWNGCAVWGEGGGKLLILENVNVENCKVQNHGIIGVYSITAEINGLTVKNSSGIAVGVGTAGHGGKLKISNSNITSCTTGIVAGNNEKTNNMFTATIGDNVTISNCTTGISAYPGKEVNITGSNVNVKENSKSGIYIASLTSNKDTGDLIGAVVNVTGSLNVTGNKSNGIYIAENSLLKLNGTVNITGNTVGEIGMVSPDSVEVGADFAGTAGVTVATNDIWFGHLAENVKNLNGTLYEGLDPNGRKGAVYGSLIGSGKVTHNGNTYSLKNNITRDLGDSALVIGYKMYKKTGSKEAGYKRVGADVALGTGTLSGGDIYLLSDITLSDNIKQGASSTPANHFDFTGDTNVANIYGNGHTINIHDDYTKTQFFAIYQGGTMNFHDLIYNGKGKAALAYVHCGASPRGGGAISADNVIIYNGKNGRAGGFYTSSANYTGTIDVKNTKFIACRGENGGALCAEGISVLKVSDCDFISCTATSNGGAIYIPANKEISMSGEINATGNKVNGVENNVYIAAGAKIKIEENITGSIGISMTQSGETFGRIANAGITGIESFYADRAEVREYTAMNVPPTVRKVTGVLFPATVGDGALNGNTVINMDWKNDRIKDRELDVVLHWPWIVVKNDDTRYGYVSLHSAHSGLAETSYIYAQKDMTIQHLWNKAINADTKTDERTDIYAHVEFPLPGSENNLHHINTGTHLNIDGNGHVITVDKSDGNYMFVIYGENKRVRLNNFIYDADKPMATIHSSASKGSEAVIINNSYIKSPNRNIVGAFKGGTVTVNDSTLFGSFDIGTGSGLILNNTSLSKPSGKSVNISGVAPVVENGETTTPAKISYVTVDGDTEISTGLGIYANNGYVEITIEKNFTGAIELNEANKAITCVKPGEGFTALDSVKSITKAGTSGATFAYYDATTGKFGWTAAPVLAGATDSGKYEDGTGLVRFMTTFTKAPINAVENYGTYVIGESNFEGDPAGITKFGKFENAPTKDGQAYIVDVINIQPDNMNEDITAISFVKIKGITTPIYSYFKTVNFNTAANGEVKDLGEKA